MEEEEEVVLPVIRQQISEEQQLEMARRLLLDLDGEDVAFNRGNIWIEVLAPGQDVDYVLGQPAQ